MKHLPHNDIGGDTAYYGMHYHMNGRALIMAFPQKR